MTHSEFNHFLDSINMLSPEQMRQLRSELDNKLEQQNSQPPVQPKVPSERCGTLPRSWIKPSSTP